MSIMYKLEDAGYWLKDNLPLFAIIGVFILPTIIYHTIIAQGGIPPRFIYHISAKTVPQGLGALIIGVGVGLYLSKTGDR